MLELKVRELNVSTIDGRDDGVNLGLRELPVEPAFLGVLLPLALSLRGSA